MRNVSILGIQNGQLILSVDLNVTGETSTSGKSVVVANSAFDVVQVDGAPYSRSGDVDPLKLSLTLLEEPNGTQAAREAAKGKGKKAADMQAMANKIDALTALIASLGAKTAPVVAAPVPVAPAPALVKQNGSANPANTLLPNRIAAK